MRGSITYVLSPKHRHAAAALLAAAILTGTTAIAQRVVLPNGTGGVEPAGSTANWTVLRSADLDLATRATDPEPSAARRSLLRVISQLRDQQRTAEHVLFHQPGVPTDTIRLVNAYSSAGGVAGDELGSDDGLTRIRDALQQELAKEAGATRHLTSQRIEWREDTPGAMVEFELTHADGTAQHLRHYVLPAGDHLQYFDCLAPAGDMAAAAEFELLLRTFDGIADPPAGTNGLIIGGISGAVAGMLAAMLRRRRQYRQLGDAAEARQATTNANASPGSDASAD